MKNWFDIVAPHEDIRTGDFDESIFAADLADVASGTAPRDYSDPQRFFEKTFLTDGLQQLLVRVYRKLAEGEGNAILELKTPFGGGKTHSLVTIYHYLKNGEEVKEFLPKELKIISPKIFVCVGTHLNPVSDKSGFRTLWGMLGYQVAGEEGLKFFAENDQRLVSPGKEKLREFLQKQQPFILLFDEVLEYINRAAGVNEGKNNLGAQTFAFFQELTEAVASLPNGMLVATLPSSILEDYGEDQHKYLARLDKIFSRIKSVETPIRGEEVYSIVSRRLFANHKDEKAAKETINEYFELYQKSKDDLPLKVRQTDFKRKMELAYPFHPDVIDILYEKWSTFHSFQRTRGVLRLLANIVKDLYDREEGIDLILPGDINLDVPKVRQEFLSHIGSEYEGVIDSDIAGHQAKSQLLDKENRDWKHLAEAISTAVFFSSFCADPSERGTTLPYVKLAVLRPDVVSSLVTEIIESALLKELWYLEKKEEKYYFSDTPTLNKVLRDKTGAFEKEDLEEEISQILKGHLGDDFVIYLWPDKSEDIPDNKELKLVVLHPDMQSEQTNQFIKKRGDSDRIYKNTLIFTLPDENSYLELGKEVREYMALKELESEIQSGERSNLESKKAEVKRRLGKIEQNLSYLVRGAYRKVRIGERELSLGQPTVGVETLSNWIRRELESEEEIVNHVSPDFVFKKFLAENEQVYAEQILDQFYKNTSLPTIESKDVVAFAIREGSENERFGLVRKVDGELDPNSLRFGTTAALPSFDSEELVVTPELAEKLSLGVSIPEGEGGELAEPEGPERLPEEREPSEPVYKKVRLSIKNIPSSRIADFNRGVLKLLASKIGEVQFDVSLSIEKEERTISESMLEKIRESLKQIGAELEEHLT